MTYRLEPRSPVSESVRQIATSQIEDVLATFGDDPLSAKAVHETRKAVKRLRALLSLVRHGLKADDLRQEKDRLRAIAHSLAGARDAHVMTETATTLGKGAIPREYRPAARAVVALLEARRADLEARAAAEAEGQAATDAEPGQQPSEALQEALEALRALPLDGLTFDDVLKGFTETYRRGSKLSRVVFKADMDDERIHDFRKDVQQHWRHLQLLGNSWPKMLRPQIGVARELSETLGRDHDLAVLAGFVRDEADQFAQVKRLDAYIEYCVGEQRKLRDHAGLLARRLYAEKPKALRRRLKVYWQTAEALGDEKQQQTDGAKVVAMSR